jgi:hypothetical protein
MDDQAVSLQYRINLWLDRRTLARQARRLRRWGRALGCRTDEQLLAFADELHKRGVHPSLPKLRTLGERPWPDWRLGVAVLLGVIMLIAWRVW